jgi:hypothetical protein
MSAPRLTTYRFRVYGGNPEDPEEFTVHAFGRDIQRVESEFASRKWGSDTTSRPMTAAAMSAYFAMTRSHLYAGTYEEFEDWYLSIEPIESVNADPIDAGPVPASP